MSSNVTESFSNNFSKVEEYLSSCKDRAYYYIYKFLTTYPIYLNDLLVAKVEDYHYELGNDYIVVKGYAYPIPESISHDMKNYASLLAPESYLFVSQRGKRIHPTAFSRLLGNIAKMYNLSDLNCLELRKMALHRQSSVTSIANSTSPQNSALVTDMDAVRSQINTHLQELITIQERNCASLQEAILSFKKFLSEEECFDLYLQINQLASDLEGMVFEIEPMELVRRKREQQNRLMCYANALCSFPENNSFPSEKQTNISNIREARKSIYTSSEDSIRVAKQKKLRELWKKSYLNYANLHMLLAFKGYNRLLSIHDLLCIFNGKKEPGDQLYKDLIEILEYSITM